MPSYQLQLIARLSTVLLTIPYRDSQAEKGCPATPNETRQEFGTNPRKNRFISAPYV